jgi:hypothetical protein
MESIPQSNLYFTNKVALLYFLAIEEVIGKKGINATLNLGHLSHLIDNYPPDNGEKVFDFANLSNFTKALEDIYGSKGGRLLNARAGKIYFNSALSAFGEQAGLTSPEFVKLSPLERLRIGLPLITKASNMMSDQNVTTEERENDFTYTYNACPACWGRSGEEKPMCYMQYGFLQGCVEFLMKSSEFYLQEEKCHAVGDPYCQFVIKKPTEG